MTPLPTLPSRFVAQSEQTDVGFIDGNYTDTHIDDDLPELLIEETTKGAPVKRISYLAHTWVIEIVDAADAELLLSADVWHTATSDSESFQFAYSTDGVTFTDMFVVVNDGSPKTYAYPLPPMAEGTIYVRVEDLDRTEGNSLADTLSVDELRVEAFRATTAVHIQKFETRPQLLSVVLLLSFGLLMGLTAAVSPSRMARA
jgi:hypothetical protein